MERATGLTPRFFCIYTYIIYSINPPVWSRRFNNFRTANMRLFYLLLLLTPSVSGFAQSSTNVKITLSDKVITIPKEDFVSLSFEDAEEQKDEFVDDIYIVGYGDFYDGIHSFPDFVNAPPKLKLIV